MRVSAVISFLIFLIVCMPNFGDAGCSSDFNCGIGYRCVKAAFQSQGTCMKLVNEFGVPTYDMPKLDSIGPNMSPGGDCNFDTDCPIGFQCHRKYKVCVKR